MDHYFLDTQYKIWGENPNEKLVKNEKTYPDMKIWFCGAGYGVGYGTGSKFGLGFGFYRGSNPELGLVTIEKKKRKKNTEFLGQ